MLGDNSNLIKRSEAAIDKCRNEQQKSMLLCEQARLFHEKSAANALLRKTTKGKRAAKKSR